MFPLTFFVEGTFTSFVTDKKKVIKKSQNSRNYGFLYSLFLLDDGMIRTGYRSVPLTNGYGPGRPKNFRIQNTDLGRYVWPSWIRFRYDSTDSVGIHSGSSNFDY
jgi:hypothetical protein